MERGDIYKYEGLKKINNVYALAIHKHYHPKEKEFLLI